MHLYQLGVGGDPGAAGWGALTPGERMRAASIRDRQRRNRFVARRAALHAVLRDYGDVCVSTAHSGDVAAVAVSPRRVGVDIEIETIRRLQDRIAARMFAPDERRVLAAAADDDRRRLFHRCWVAKEAYAKGLGQGLAIRFDEFSVTSALRSPDGIGAVGRDWTVAVTTRGDVHVAVAAPGGGLEVVRVG